MLKFEWDPVKAAENRRKHGVSFEEAKAVFTSGAEVAEFDDDWHCDLETRFVAVGWSGQRLLHVVFTERDDDSLRIISARRVNRAEHEEFARWLRRTSH